MNRKRNFTKDLYRSFLLFALVSGVGCGIFFIVVSYAHTLHLIDSRTQITKSVVDNSVELVRLEYLRNTEKMSKSHLIRVASRTVSFYSPYLEEMREELGATGVFVFETDLITNKLIKVNSNTNISSSNLQLLTGRLDFNIESEIVYSTFEDSGSLFIYSRIPDVGSFQSTINKVYYLVVRLSFNDINKLISSRMGYTLDARIDFYDITNIPHRNIINPLSLTFWEKSNSCYTAQQLHRVAYCISLDTKKEITLFKEQVTLVVIVSIFLIVLSIEYARSVSEKLAKPIKSLIEGMKETTLDEFTPLRVDTNGQIGYLVDTFNDLIIKIKTANSKVILERDHQKKLQVILDTVLNNLKNDAVILLKKNKAVYISRPVLRILNDVNHSVNVLKPSLSDTNEHYLWKIVQSVFGDISSDTTKKINNRYYEFEVSKIDIAGEEEEFKIVVIRDVSKHKEKHKELETYCTALLQSQQNVQIAKSQAKPIIDNSGGPYDRRTWT